MINLKKEEKSHKTFSFSEEDFVNIKWQNIGKNKRIFISDSELLNENEERCAFLNSLISYIEQKTGKNCSYIPVNETEPYEVNRFYAQYAPELLDYDGCYVENNSLAWNRSNREWHVSYYYKNKTLHIILDNEKRDYQVVKNFLGFSVNLRMGYYIPHPEPEDKFRIMDEKKITEKASSDKREKLTTLLMLWQELVLLCYYFSDCPSTYKKYRTGHLPCPVVFINDMLQ